MWHKQPQEVVEPRSNNSDLRAFGTLATTKVSGGENETRTIGGVCSRGVNSLSWLLAYVNGHGRIWTKQLVERSTNNVLANGEFNFDYSDSLQSPMKYTNSEIETICPINNSKAGFINSLEQKVWMVIANFFVKPVFKQL